MRTFNGWDSVPSGSHLLHTWAIPGTGRANVHLPLRRGSAGFLLAHNAMWYDEVCERLDVDKIPDDWGHAPRPPSNHGSATATDLNSTRHPFHVALSRTYTPSQIAAIRRHLKVYEGAVDFGGFWRDPDGMHFEIAPGTSMAKCERVARKLIEKKNRRALAVLKANPGQKRVIYS